MGEHKLKYKEIARGICVRLKVSLLMRPSGSAFHCFRLTFQIGTDKVGRKGSGEWGLRCFTEGQA